MVNNMKKLWVSIICFIAALIFFVMMILSIFIFNEDLFIYISLYISSFSTVLILIIMGVASLPDKGDKNE